MRLYYQTLSKEHVEFLRDENRTNDWGNKLYQAWLSNGMSAPELMAATSWGTPPADTAAPSAPAGLTAKTASRSQINLSWTAASDNLAVAGYYIYRGGTRAASLTASTFSDKGLKSNTTYCYVVAAFDAAGNESPWSNQACATTLRK